VRRGEELATLPPAAAGLATTRAFRYDVTMSLQFTSTETPAPAAAPDLEPATRVLRQFRIVFNSVKTHFRRVEREAGLGGAQLWALSVIAQSPGIGVTELARSLDIHQSTASNLVRTLTARGLVSAARDGFDRRGVALRALPAADALLQNAPLPFAGVLPDALSSLDAATLERLEADLASLIALLAADEDSAQVPLAQL
jgi:DNA-binding MarR family transcriptional regulator